MIAHLDLTAARIAKKISQPGVTKVSNGMGTHSASPTLGCDPYKEAAMFLAKTWLTSVGLSLGFAYGSVAWCQSPAPSANQQTPVAQTRPASTDSPLRTGTLALPVIADAQRGNSGDSGALSTNLFAQERDSYDQVREAEQAARSNVATTPSDAVSRSIAPLISPSDADMLRRAGIILGSPLSSRLIVERVMPNSAGFAAGIQFGDVIRHIDHASIAFNNPLQPVAATQDTNIGIDVERHGKITRHILRMAAADLVRAWQTDAGQLRELPVYQATQSGSMPGSSRR